ncbi:MAG: Sugar-specific transcriptional regulator TrmB, partial [Mycobacterium sp.]|nr:Sugar-specific transcriptional regulator TrmB [Mycobacterium sp.]
MCPPADGPRAGARTVIGLCAAEQAAYELLIEHPAATLDELSAEWSRPEPLAFLLTRLEDAGAASSVPGSPT